MTIHMMIQLKHLENTHTPELMMAKLFHFDDFMENGTLHMA